MKKLLIYMGLLAGLLVVLSACEQDAPEERNIPEKVEGWRVIHCQSCTPFDEGVAGGVRIKPLGDKYWQFTKGDKLYPYVTDADNKIRILPEIVIEELGSGNTALFNLRVPNSAKKLYCSLIPLEIEDNQLKVKEERRLVDLAHFVKLPSFWEADLTTLGEFEPNIRFRPKGSIVIIEVQNQSSEEMRGTFQYEVKSGRGLYEQSLYTVEGTSVEGTSHTDPYLGYEQAIAASETKILYGVIFPHETNVPSDLTISYQPSKSETVYSTTPKNKKTPTPWAVGKKIRVTKVQWTGSTLKWAPKMEGGLALLYPIRFRTPKSFFSPQNLRVEASEADKGQVWIDRNGNGTYDEGEKILLFGRTAGENNKLTITPNQEYLVCGKISYIYLMNLGLDKFVVDPNNEALQEIVITNNNLSGEAVDDLITSLPNRKGKDSGKLYFRHTFGTYAGKMTPEQVQAAKAKNWNVYKSSSGSIEYRGE